MFVRLILLVLSFSLNEVVSLCPDVPEVSDHRDVPLGLEALEEGVKDDEDAGATNASAARVFGLML